MFAFWKFVHMLTMALWLGGMFAISLFVARSRRIGDRRVTAFAYSTARRLYRGIVLVAAVLSIISGGALMVITARPFFQPFPEHWLFQMQVFGLLALVATLAFVIPNAGTIAGLAERAVEEGSDPPELAGRVKLQAMVGSLVGLALIYTVLLGALRL